MFVHIVMWKIKKEYEDKKDEIKNKLKLELENLKNSISKVNKIEVIKDVENTSTHEIMLYSEFEKEEDFGLYAKDERHLLVVKEYILPYLEERVCIDYIK